MTPGVLSPRRPPETSRRCRTAGPEAFPLRQAHETVRQPRREDGLSVWTAGSLGRVCDGTTSPGDGPVLTFRNVPPASRLAEALIPWWQGCCPVHAPSLTVPGTQRPSAEAFGVSDATLAHLVCPEMSRSPQRLCPTTEWSLLSAHMAQVRHRHMKEDRRGHLGPSLT